jgi:putative Mg2+ transporter-C (MgtC) family protein
MDDDWFADFLTQGVSPLLIVIRLSLATVLGALFGWEREASDKPAGLRTHMLVSIGSATFTLLGFETGAQLAERFGDAGLDPTRIVQGIIGGLGFLGAGSIIKSRNADDVTGITTAASVWFTGALGVACGMGAFLLAGISALLGILVLTLLRHVPKGRPPAQRPRRRRRVVEEDDDDIEESTPLRTE